MYHPFVTYGGYSMTTSEIGDDKSDDLKTWEKYKLFLHQAHREQKIAVTTTGKEGYIAAVKNITNQARSKN